MQRLSPFANDDRAIHKSQRFVFTLALVILTFACEQEPSQEEKNRVQSSKKILKPYSPPPGYAPSSSDPLLALYGGSKGKGPSGMTDAKLKAEFESTLGVELGSGLPKSWRNALSKLGQSLPLKVTKWKSTTGTRMERGQQNRSITITLTALGLRSKVLSDISSSLSQLSEFRQLPKRLGDQHEHSEERHEERASLRLSLTKSSEKTTDPLSIASLELSWSRQYPNPTTLDKNCRYVHGLSPQLGEQAIDWAAQHFKSTGTRRFVEWSEEHNPKRSISLATWIYRNGSYRDKAVGWWTDQVTARGATQTSMTGMEQAWSSQHGWTIEWWPETDPSPMGCEVAGPLLSVSLTRLKR